MRGPTSVSLADEQQNKRKAREKADRRGGERRGEEGTSASGPMRSRAKEVRGG